MQDADVRHFRGARQQIIHEGGCERLAVFVIGYFFVERRANALRRAAETGFDGTDDASFVEEAGGRVRIVPGDARNVKVTDPTDLLLAEALWLDATGGRRAGKGRPGGGPS